MRVFLYTYTFHAVDAWLVTASVKAVVRVIAMSTKVQIQQQRNVTLYCRCHYPDTRRSPVRTMLGQPSPIGNVIIIIIIVYSHKNKTTQGTEVAF